MIATDLRQEPTATPGRARRRLLERYREVLPRELAEVDADIRMLSGCQARAEAPHVRFPAAGIWLGFGFGVEQFTRPGGPTTMKAARLHACGQPLVVEEVATPSAGPGEVLVRVHGAGFCHSDLHVTMA